jgi:CO/xanthine dehydrogenase Mo-binding subunit
LLPSTKQPPIRRLELIECDYETLPAALTVDEALRENAPLVHEQLDSYR